MPDVRELLEQHTRDVAAASSGEFPSGAPEWSFMYSENPEEIWQLSRPLTPGGVLPQDQYIRTEGVEGIGDTGYGVPVTRETAYERVADTPLQVYRRHFDTGTLLGTSGSPMEGGGFDFQGDTLPLPDDLQVADSLKASIGTPDVVVPGESDIGFPMAAPDKIKFNQRTLGEFLGPEAMQMMIDQEERRRMMQKMQEQQGVPQ